MSGNIEETPDSDAVQVLRDCNPMGYQVLFNRKSSLLVLAIGSVAGVLLFASGYLVGVHRGARNTRIELEKQYAAQESKPSNSLEPAASQSSAPAPDAPPVAPEAPSPVLADNLAGSSAEGFAVQAGAFQAEDAASSLREELTAKGYSPFVFKAQDSAGQVWYTVRIGRYKELKEATRAAVVFTMKEKMPANVRPGNAL